MPRGANELGKMVYQARWMHEGASLERRIKALESMRMVDGKPTSFGKFLHDYIRSMSFTYHASGGKAKKYRKIMLMVEEMARKQWETFKEAV
jgi:hypothetical protein